MVQIAVTAERSPIAVQSHHEERARSYSDGAYAAAAAAAASRRSESRMSTNHSDDDEEEEDDSGFRDRCSSDAKTSSSDMSVQESAGQSPKSEGFSSPMSEDTNQSINRMRTVLDLSMPSAFSRKTTGSSSRPGERRPSFSNALVPPYSPLSSSAGSRSSSSSGSPSVTPEVKMDEVSVAYIAAMAKESSHRVPLPPAGGSEFDLPKNFYGYYVYQMELASRYNNAKNAAAASAAGSHPGSRNVSPPLPVATAGKGKTKESIKDDDIVSYGSLLEQALRNGLKRSPAEMPAATGSHVEGGVKKAKVAGGPVAQGQGHQSATPPPAPTVTNLSMNSPQNSGLGQLSAAACRSSSSGQVSVEDVAKVST